MFALMIIAGQTFLHQNRLAQWDQTVWVGVFPMNADGEASTQAFIDQLTLKDIQVVEDFVNLQAKKYGVTFEEPISIQLRGKVTTLPPEPPRQAKWYQMMWWSLKFRFWTMQHQKDDGRAKSKLNLYLAFRSLKNGMQYTHSYALRKTRAGVVNAYAAKRLHGMNQVIMTHELLHLFGATDKYNLSSTYPNYPDGYADPDKTPLYPQKKAEIMGGRIPINQQDALIPPSLRYAMVGPETAMEVGWLDQHEASE